MQRPLFFILAYRLMINRFWRNLIILGCPLFFAYEEDIAPYKGELEIWYVQNLTVRLDIKLILLTFLVVIFPNNGIYERFLRAVPKKPPEILELYAS